MSTQSVSSKPASSPPVSLKRIGLFFAPLAASWMLILAEGPLFQGVLARLSEVTLTLAAFGVVVALQVTIESPIINLLSTTTALARSQTAYFVLRRFMIHINAALTVIALLLAYTRAFDLVVLDMMGVSSDIGDRMRPGMKIMVLWSAAIGWRRFNQGLLIRFGQTHLVGWGSGLRLLSSVGTALTLAYTTDLGGVSVGAWGLMAGVSLEALFAHVAARATVKRHLSGLDDEGSSSLTYGDVLKFHTPLALTAVLSLLVQPIVAAGLSRMPSPAQNLAAWPIAYNALLFFRSFGFAVTETVIALSGKNEARRALGRFCFILGLTVTGTTLIFAATPLSSLYLTRVLGIPGELSAFVIPGILMGSLIPALHIIQSWYRGWLVAVGQPGDVYRGMAIHLFVVVIGVFLSSTQQVQGVLTAFGVIIAAIVFEVIFLKARLASRESLSTGAH